MPRTIDEAEARKTALNHIAKQEKGAQGEIKSVDRQEIWLLEVAWPAQNENTKGTQFAKVTVTGSGEIKDYEKTHFKANSLTQRIASKLRGAFSRGDNKNDSGENEASQR